ncbi:hypothetical protein LCGC14_1266370 [marine sediment metagenome]|uniref:PspA/IM30 family protein n=1 Tax=marine sediment metagenome TaxID=412755 RepID=A0A0F9KZE1_9ZZZZ
MQQYKPRNRLLEAFLSLFNHHPVDEIEVELNLAIKKTKSQLHSTLKFYNSLKTQCSNETKESLAWQERATKAISNGKDELSKIAIERKLAHTELASRYQVEIDKLDEHLDYLDIGLKELEYRAESIVRDRNILIVEKQSEQVRNRLIGIANTIKSTNEKLALKANMADSKLQLEQAQHEVPDDIKEFDTHRDIQIQRDEQVEEEFNQMKKWQQYNDNKSSVHQTLQHIATQGLMERSKGG